MGLVLPPVPVVVLGSPAEAVLVAPPVGAVAVETPAEADDVGGIVELFGGLQALPSAMVYSPGMTFQQPFVEMPK